MMRKKINVLDLRPGMYISELDRPWLETPFLFQGFEIQTEQEIAEIKRYCSYVFVDEDKNPSLPHLRSSGAIAAQDKQVELDILKKSAAPTRFLARYQDQTSVEQELEPAQEYYFKNKELIVSIMDDARLGKSLDAEGAKQAVTGMVSSILRNPDALMCLTQLKNVDEYTTTHCLRVCILALSFGRHLGLSQDELYVLGMGALFHDIGKMRVPVEILNKPARLTHSEFEIIKKHVPEGVALLERTKGIPMSALDIVRSHHERVDGSGYMRGLKGNQISKFGQIAAIVDCYDAITSNRVYHSAMSAHEALKRIYTVRKKDFDETYVEEFIRCVGIYPIGSLIETNTGHVGVVMTINRARYLRPKIRLVLNQHKTRYANQPTVDLSLQARDEAGHPWEIKTVLEPGTYGINPVDFLPIRKALLKP